MRIRILTATGLLLALALSACVLVNPPSQQRKAALDDFMHALRWQRYAEAASHFTGEHRRSFLTRFERIAKDLNVTDVRLQGLQLKDEGRRAEVVLEMDYYLFPSTVLKTLRIEQTWVYFETGDSEFTSFLITTPFPEFPEESSRGKGTLPP